MKSRLTPASIAFRGAILGALTALTALAASASHAADVVPNKRGQLLFLQCRACHELQSGLPHKTGPNLGGVFGRTAGTAAGFKYTDAMAKSGIVWNASTLDAFLRQPGACVPGTGMAFAGIASDADRTSLIEYLAVAAAATPAAISARVRSEPCRPAR